MKEKEAQAESAEKAPQEAPAPIVSVVELSPASHSFVIQASGTALPERASLLPAALSCPRC